MHLIPTGQDSEKVCRLGLTGLEHPSVTRATIRRMERAAGIEPAMLGWKPNALPLGDARTDHLRKYSLGSELEKLTVLADAFANTSREP